MATEELPFLKDQLLERRARLRAVTKRGVETDEISALLRDVDAALERMDRGKFGLCKVCGDPIEPGRLITDPLMQFCLDHLNPSEQKALEQDLQLAASIQQGMLPVNGLAWGGWSSGYRFHPLGIVSGDYCDLLMHDETLFFMLGDVSGKGVSACMLMVHLHAMLRTLVSLGLSLTQIVERANHLFCESTLPNHFATLVFGRASSSGEVEICNAGHVPPILLTASGTQVLETSNLPLGMFCVEQFKSESLRLGQGDVLLVSTDGLTEAQDPEGMEFGLLRLTHLMEGKQGLTPGQLVDACFNQLQSFLNGSAVSDDLAILALQRSL